MTWLAIAKKDFRDGVQSRALWALVVVFVNLWGDILLADYGWKRRLASQQIGTLLR